MKGIPDSQSQPRSCPSKNLRYGVDPSLDTLHDLLTTILKAQWTRPQIVAQRHDTPMAAKRRSRSESQRIDDV